LAPAAQAVSKAAVTKDWVMPSFLGVPDIIMILMVVPPFGLDLYPCSNCVQYLHNSSIGFLPFL